MNKLSLLLSLACLYLVPAFAQEIDHTVVFPKGDAKWSVAYVVNTPHKNPAMDLKPKAAEGDRELTVDIVRQGNLRRDVTTWSHGAKSEMWWVQQPTVALVQTLRGGVNVMTAAEVDGLRFDETCFAWVGQKTYTGKQAYGGKSCQLYRKDSAAGPATITQYAWIDSATHEPVAFYNGTSLVTFAFFPDAPISPLSMPEKLQKEMARYVAFYGSIKKVGPQ